MKSKFLIIIIILFVFNIQNVKAQTENNFSIRLDDKTVSKGYTIKDKNNLVNLVIWPNIFKQAVTINIQTIIYDEKFFAAKILSDVVSVKFDQMLDKSYLLKINFQSFSNLPKQVWWRKDSQSFWEKVSSRTENKFVLIESINQGQFIITEAEPSNIEEILNYLSAQNAIVVDAKSGQVLFEKNIHQQRSIASLTKLMTAMVYLERPRLWNDVVGLQKSDTTIPVVAGFSKATVKDWWFAMLTKSANDSAKLLARISGLSEKDYIARMNNLAKELDLSKTKFSDVSGLDKGNVSTAFEMAQIARAAFSHFDILQAVGVKDYQTSSLADKNVLLKNSTNLFESDLTIDAAKTGYTYEAGRCQIIRVISKDKKIIVVVLGSSAGKHTTDAYDLAKWFIK